MDDEDKKMTGENDKTSEAWRNVVPMSAPLLLALRATVNRLAVVEWPARRRALILRTIGGLFERSGHDDEAIAAYEFALAAQPDVGVKQRLRILRARGLEKKR